MMAAYQLSSMSDSDWLFVKLFVLLPHQFPSMMAHEAIALSFTAPNHFQEDHVAIDDRSDWITDPHVFFTSTIARCPSQCWR
tara:strand:+ start:94 stop:339 length:246 start_codon:yes stop_codon:yes gene_type:complete